LAQSPGFGDETQGAVVAGEERPSEKVVKFSTLSIRDYPPDIGDNPSAKAGPPLTLAWEPMSEIVGISIDEYESSRPPRRFDREMIVPPDTREKILRDAGFSRAEITDRTKPVNVARAQRIRTIETMGLAPLHEFSQSVSRKTRNILSFGERKRKEREFLQPFRRRHSDPIPEVPRHEQNDPMRRRSSDLT
jgi:hypothetical protein